MRGLLTILGLFVFWIVSFSRVQGQLENSLEPPPITPDDESFAGLTDYDDDDSNENGDFRDSIPGEPGRDYPLNSKPPAAFSCQGREPGYYADVESGCQGFHVCDSNYGFIGESKPLSFLCPNGTLFNQAIQVCDWWRNVDCALAPINFPGSDEDHQDLQIVIAKQGEDTRPDNGTVHSEKESGSPRVTKVSKRKKGGRPVRIIRKLRKKQKNSHGGHQVKDGKNVQEFLSATESIEHQTEVLIDAEGIFPDNSPSEDILPPLEPAGLGSSARGRVKNQGVTRRRKISTTTSRPLRGSVLPPVKEKEVDRGSLNPFGVLGGQPSLDRTYLPPGTTRGRYTQTRPTRTPKPTRSPYTYLPPLIETGPPVTEKPKGYVYTTPRVTFTLPTRTRPPATYLPPEIVTRPPVTYLPPEIVTRPPVTYLPPEIVTRPPVTYLPPEIVTRPPVTYLPPEIVTRPPVTYLPPEIVTRPPVTYLPPEIVTRPPVTYLPPEIVTRPPVTYLPPEIVTRPPVTYLPPEIVTRPPVTYLPPEIVTRPPVTYLPPNTYLPPEEPKGYVYTTPRVPFTLPTRTRPPVTYLPPEIVTRPPVTYLPPEIVTKPPVTYLPPEEPIKGYIYTTPRVPFTLPTRTRPPATYLLPDIVTRPPVTYLPPEEPKEYVYTTPGVTFTLPTRTRPPATYLPPDTTTERTTTTRRRVTSTPKTTRLPNTYLPPETPSTGYVYPTPSVTFTLPTRTRPPATYLPPDTTTTRPTTTTTTRPPITYLPPFETTTSRTTCTCPTNKPVGYIYDEPTNPLRYPPRPPYQGSVPAGSIMQPFVSPFFNNNNNNNNNMAYDPRYNPYIMQQPGYQQPNSQFQQRRPQLDSVSSAQLAASHQWPGAAPGGYWPGWGGPGYGWGPSPAWSAAPGPGWGPWWGGWGGPGWWWGAGGWGPGWGHGSQGSQGSQ